MIFFCNFASAQLDSSLIASLYKLEHVLFLLLCLCVYALVGDGNFGDKTVSDFAHDYIQASKQNPHNFIPPKITFVFFDGVTESIAGNERYHVTKVHFTKR